MSYSFIDKVYDGISKDKITNKNKIFLSIKESVSRVGEASNVLGDRNSIDQINIDAYNSGSEWQRDYIYYGIMPGNPNGEFRNNYSEFITSFKFLTPDILSVIADQDGDPRVNNQYAVGNAYKAPKTMWTDGRFEFRITVLINSKNGIGNEVVKQMLVNPADLFDLQYEEIKKVRRVNDREWSRLYELRGVTCKEYHPNFELVPWDLENYGMGWKIIFYEVDGTQEITQSFENTTTYASNFEINGSIGTKTKVGYKFGATATQSDKRSFSVKTSAGSDFLGEATLTFDQPIIIGQFNGQYTTREITNGNTISISVEPRRTK